MSGADDLHEELFGYRPDKPGTAYERLAAVVLAEQGWENVRHDSRLRVDGGRSTHQLDVTATDPDGSVKRLLVECKDWNRDVGQGTLNALVGVRDQTGFDAAMAVTTKGFTAGAVDVAVDQDVAMVVLREIRADDHFVMGYRIEFSAVGHHWSNVQLLVAEGEDVADDALRSMSTHDHLLYPDGTRAERLLDVLHSQGSAWEKGSFERKTSFEGGRMVPTSGGGQMPIVGMRWTETVSESSPMVSERNESGKPCLVVEHIDDKGKGQDGRLFVDRHLNTWDIDDAGEVRPRGRLGEF